MKPIFFFIFIATILTGCQSKSGQRGDLPEIDLSKKYPQKEVRLGSIADIEYLPLETVSEVLLDEDAKVFYFSEKYILVLNQRLGEVLAFDRNGKNTGFFRIPRGRGPMEFAIIERIAFDDVSEEIYIVDISGKILVYSLTSEYLRTMEEVPGLTSWSCLLNFDENTFLVYEEYAKRDGYQPPEKPYFLVSKDDGSVILSLNVIFPDRFPIAVIESFNLFEYTFPVNRHFGQDFVIADISSDTVFMLTKQRELKPLLVRTPTVVDSSEPRTVWRTELTTDKFIVLRTMVMNFEKFMATGERDRNPVFIKYEFETGQISELVSFVIDDFPTFNWESGRKPFFDIVDNPQKNVAVKLLDVALLKEAQEENKLKGELEKLVTTLDEEDNPVIMIVNFKF